MRVLGPSGTNSGSLGDTLHPPSVRSLTFKTKMISVPTSQGLNKTISLKHLVRPVSFQNVRSHRPAVVGSADGRLLRKKDEVGLLRRFTRLALSSPLPRGPQATLLQRAQF